MGFYHGIQTKKDVNSSWDKPSSQRAPRQNSPSNPTQILCFLRVRKQNQCSSSSLEELFAVTNSEQKPRPEKSVLKRVDPLVFHNQGDSTNSSRYRSNHPTQNKPTKTQLTIMQRIANTHHNADLSDQPSLGTEFLTTLDTTMMEMDLILDAPGTIREFNTGTSNIDTPNIATEDDAYKFVFKETDFGTEATVATTTIEDTEYKTIHNIEMELIED